MMKNIFLVFHVARNAFSENVRSRFFTLFAVFAIAAVYASVLAGVMAIDQEGRVLTDFGLALMELTVLAYALFNASAVLLREAETKTIYLVFSRPVPRWAYLGGKLAGSLATSAVLLGLMGVMHLLLLKFRGFPPPAGYAWALLGSLMKLSVITSLAFFISLFSTSAVSTMIISGVIWTAGHFAAETHFLAEHSEGAKGVILKAALWLIPNFQLFNARDTGGTLAPAAFASAVLWTAGAYFAGLWLLSRKEF